LKKLILIFTLLLSSLNLSATAQLLKDNSFVKEMDTGFSFDSAAESYDTYKTFLTFNKQQDIDNPTGSRVSDELMFDAKNMAMVDLVSYAVNKTFKAATARDETITTRDEIQQQDIVDGINAAREIIGPLVNNPVFSVRDQEIMSTAVNNFVRYHNNIIGDGTLSVDNYLNSILFTLGEGIKYDLINRYRLEKRHVRFIIEDANKFTKNFLSTFFTNQNAVQSTCLSASCVVPLGGM
jgi:hypothetical protein